jgi:hypothetical protein
MTKNPPSMPVDPPGDAPVNDSNEPRFCQSCGHTLLGGHFCPNCGSPAMDTSARPETTLNGLLPPHNKRGNSKKTAGIIVAALVLIVSIVLITNGSNMLGGIGGINSGSGADEEKTISVKSYKWSTELFSNKRLLVLTLELTNDRDVTVKTSDYRVLSTSYDKGEYWLLPDFDT